MKIFLEQPFKWQLIDQMAVCLISQLGSITKSGRLFFFNHAPFQYKFYILRYEHSWEICMQVKKKQLELNMEQQTGSK